MTKAYLSAAAVLLLLSACADDPSFTNTANTKPSDNRTVSICYNGSTTTREALEAMALSRCPGESPRVEVHDHDTFWNACPISKKTRVTFVCNP